MDQRVIFAVLVLAVLMPGAGFGQQTTGKNSPAIAGNNNNVTYNIITQVTQGIPEQAVQGLRDQLAQSQADLATKTARGADKPGS